MDRPLDSLAKSSFVSVSLAPQQPVTLNSEWLANDELTGDKNSGRRPTFIVDLAKATPMSDAAQTQDSNVASIGSNSALQSLTEILEPSRVLTGDDDRIFFSQDVYNQGETALAVIQPQTTDELAAAVKAATDAGIAVFPRGGGMSYTDGYIPSVAKSIIVDTSKMNKITEINEDDMYVTVQPGVTWGELYEALKAKGLRTPFWGPFSGKFATVGGSVSQGAVSFGSGDAGTSADSIMGLEIVTAEGDVIKTGAGGGEFGRPFFRHYGPDLTGIFCGDAGALGIKAEISLRLLKTFPEVMALSYKFDNFETMAQAMIRVGRDVVASEAYGMDPILNEVNLGRTEAAGKVSQVKSLLAVGKAGRGAMDGIKEMAKVAIAGTSVFENIQYAAHYSLDGLDLASAQAKAVRIRAACDPHGTEMENTVPKVFRAQPFQPMNNIILHPTGMRWVPIHGILPFSKVLPFHKDLDAVYDAYAQKMSDNKVIKAAMFTTVPNGFLYEPVFYWEDSRERFHERMMDKEVQDAMAVFETNLEGRALVQEMKGKIIDVFHKHGAIHMQIGKLYPLLRNRNAPSVALLRSIKAQVDPKNLMNPGALGL